MSKTSIALFAMFFIALGTLLILNTTYSPEPVLKGFPKIFPTKAVVSESSLSLTPNTLSAKPGKQTAIQISIDSKGEKPSLIQMELSYDPSILSAVRLMPGTFYQNPDVLLNTVNARNGRISYAIGPTKGQENASTSNIVATIFITPRINMLRGSTTIEFMPKTVIKTKTSPNILKTADGAKIILQQGFTPVASTPAVLSPEVPYQLPTAF